MTKILAQDFASSAAWQKRSWYAHEARFHSAGIDELHGEPRARGATIVAGPVDRAYELREFVVEGCHGSRLAFGEDGRGRGTDSSFASSTDLIRSGGELCGRVGCGGTRP